jgi:radical SAM superfamily enzyme YgiQ (UPF0313 family)
MARRLRSTGHAGLGLAGSAERRDRIRAVHVLLISTYELGRQPVHVASPAAAIRAVGHDVQAIDLSVQGWEPEVVDWADAVAISTPMHTAMRLAEQVARSIKRRRPDIPVASYGLYAAAASDSHTEMPFDRAIVGEYEAALVAWLTDGPNGQPISIHLDRGGFHTPDRSLLPPLEQYARLAVGTEQRLVGAVEASHGCVHLCRHCPIPAVYQGRLRVVDAESVLADIDQQVAAGARHITFGDPDFLNGPAHALRIIREMHERHPSLTFDCTVKVEHILRHGRLWEQFASSGCLFVVSAFETTNDAVLEILDKGHTIDDAARAVHLLRDVGIDIRSSWLPFTPWTTRHDIESMFRFISAHDLVESTDPVQLGIRLLIPEGSLMLEIPELEEHLGPYDSEALSYAWSADDPEVDRLSATLVAIAEAGASSGQSVADTFLAQWLAVVEGFDLDMPPDAIDQGATAARPKLTEPWFC